MRGELSNLKSEIPDRCQIQSSYQEGGKAKGVCRLMHWKSRGRSIKCGCTMRAVTWPKPLLGSEGNATDVQGDWHAAAQSFSSPVSKQASWEGFHGMWPASIVQQLRKRLPPGYVAEPRSSISAR